MRNLCLLSKRAWANVEIEEAWAAEIDRRIAEVESGAVRLIPATEVLTRARAALK